MNQSSQKQYVYKSGYYRQKQLSSAQISLSTKKVQQVKIPSKIQYLQKQLKQTKSLLATYKVCISNLQNQLQQKQILLKQMQLQQKYILKQNQQLHEKIYILNQNIKHQKSQFKQIIQNQVGLLKQQFNFIIKEAEIKNQIINQQKQRQFIRKEYQLKSIIKELSQNNSEHNNNSFFFQSSSSSNINTNKQSTVSYVGHKRDHDSYQYTQSKNSRNMLPSGLNRSRDSLKSLKSQKTQARNILTSLRDSRHSQATSPSPQKHVEKPLFCYNNSKIPSQHQTTFSKPFKLTKTPVLSRPPINKAINKPSINEIISRSKKQFQQRNKKTLNNSQSYKYLYNKQSQTNQSRISARFGGDTSQEKHKHKINQINNLKIKVNMLKNQLKEEISFSHN